MTHLIRSFKAVGLAAALTLPSLAFAADPGMVAGGVLTDHKGMTLYTFDKDEDGKSNCNDKCAQNWPPLKAQSTDTPTGKWTVITRDDDGSSQWAYNGKPVYTFIMDKKAGDRTGDGKGDVWKIAKP